MAKYSQRIFLPGKQAGNTYAHGSHTKHATKQRFNNP